MYKEFTPYQQSLELKELGFNEECAAHYLDVDDLELKWKQYRNMSINETRLLQAPLYQQAFKWFRSKYGFTYSIGKTNISVVHAGTTFIFDGNETFEDAEKATLIKFIEVAKQSQL